jgi:ABC-2 type transport system permease protein
MSHFLRQCAVVARRDFLAVVATPTFLLFLLAPLIMIIIAITGGSGATQAAQSTVDAARIAVIAAPQDAFDIKAADDHLRAVNGSDFLPKLEIIPTHGKDETLAAALFGARKTDYLAVMFGDLKKPVIRHEETSVRSAGLLAEIAEQVVRSRAAGTPITQNMSHPVLQPIKAARAGVGGQRTTAYFAVFGIFFLTLLLAGQSVGMLAEEKSNKVIEILAAALPLEAVFLGKLIGMFGVALLFVTFWSVMIGAALFFTDAGGTIMAMLSPAVGMGPFLILCGLYFTMSYMLLGAVFLGVGGQAATIRDIQMLSLPITILQVAMYGIASKGVAQPESTLARFAEIFPFSSAYAMAGHAANDPALWPHVLALIWQAMWVAATIFFAARLFRIGVLKSGGGLRAAFGLKAKTD